MRRYLFIAAFFVVSLAYAQSPYISRVWEFSPAPGQFVNVLPAYEEGDDAEAMREKAEEAIADNNRGMISLGGWGGYVVFGFDHMVPNRTGNDFTVLGNATYSETGEGRLGGSCEPGIVMVSHDANGNGRPDDPWYELAGSEYTNPLTVHGYSVTYERPENDKDPVYWEDNREQSGYIERNTYHKQPYFPQWLEQESLSFSGSRLPANGEDKYGDGSYYVLYAYPWGYADNHPNTAAEAQLDIDKAVQADGTPVHLPGIHFVKVYTALQQQCGRLGESSTEIIGAEDLSMTQPEQTQPEQTQPEETQPEQTQPEETHPEQTQPEETQPEQGLDKAQRTKEQGAKVMENGVLYIKYKGTKYNVQGIGDR